MAGFPVVNDPRIWGSKYYMGPEDKVALHLRCMRQGDASVFCRGSRKCNKE